MTTPRRPTRRRAAPTLADRLKARTHGLQMQLERSAFMNTLLRSKLQRPAYCAMLRNLHVVHAALEAALLRHAAEPPIAAIYEPALFRRQALESDLDVLHGDGWPQALAVQPASSRYAAHLDTLDGEQPTLLVAHAYVRFQGDLHGGQLLRRIVAEAFRLPGRAGTTFYDFGEAPDAAARLLAGLRAGLARTAVDEAQASAIVDEAVGAFERHRALYDELAVACGVVSTSRAPPAG